MGRVQFRCGAAQRPLERHSVVTDLAEAIRTGGMYNVVHGVLAPDAVYLTEDDSSGLTATIAEWGLEATVRGSLNNEPSISPYAAPEQLDGATFNSRTEGYQLGAIAQYVLTGVEPFTDKTDLQTAIQQGERVPPSERNPSLPSEIDDIIERAMARDPDQRFSSAYDFRRRLLAVMQ